MSFLLVILLRDSEKKVVQIKKVQGRKKPYKMKRKLKNKRKLCKGELNMILEKLLNKLNKLAKLKLMRNKKSLRKMEIKKKV